MKGRGTARVREMKIEPESSPQDDAGLKDISVQSDDEDLEMFVVFRTAGSPVYSECSE